MENRFSFKDFLFLCCFVLVIGAVVWSIYQSNYQEGRLNDVKQQLVQLSDTQKQQLSVLTEINNALKSGVRLEGGGGATQTATGADANGNIRQVNPDGSQYLFYPKVPDSPREPDKQPDYAIGDWLIQNIGAEPQRIEPFIERDMQGQIAQGPVLETLLTINPQTLEYEPYLADTMWISADGLHYKFRLRPQVCFSDGVPMTANDVVFSLKVIKDENVDAAPLRPYFEHVKACNKIDERTVEFVMDEPYFLAMQILGGIYVLPEHIYKYAKGDDYNKNQDRLVGSGAYRLEKWDRGQKITYVRNEHYWGDRPTYDKLVYLFIGDAQAQVQSFLNGEVDYLGEPIEPDPEQYLEYSKEPDFVNGKFIAYKYPRPTAMHMYIGWNMDKPMFKDKETRQALTMLVDRKTIVENMLHGFGREMTGPFKQGSPQNDPSVQAYAYDPDTAKKMLAEAGWKAGSDGVLERNGVRFEFDMSLRTGVPIRDRIATYVQQQFRDAGIRMRITPYEAGVLYERLDQRQFDACLVGWGGGGIEEDPKQIWHSKSIGDKGSNHVGYHNPEADRLIDEARMTLDEKKRMALWHQLQRVIYDDSPYIWLYSEVDTAFINGRFKNTKPYPLGLSELDWYVPAAAQKYH